MSTKHHSRMHVITRLSNISQNELKNHEAEAEACLQNARSDPSSTTFVHISGGVSTIVDPDELPRSLELSGVTPALLLDPICADPVLLTEPGLV